MSALRHTPGKDARFWIGSRDTRWDVYPCREPEEVVGKVLVFEYVDCKAEMCMRDS